MEAQTGTGRAEDSGVYEYGGKKCGACGLAVRLRAGVGRGGPKRARMGAKDPRPVWIGAGAVAVQV